MVWVCEVPAGEPTPPLPGWVQQWDGPVLIRRYTLPTQAVWRAR